jgi:hypothetical protein
VADALHSIQVSFNRRFDHGLEFAFNDTIGLVDKQIAGAAAAQRRRLVAHSEAIREGKRSLE